jgi:hypothetical protein
MLSTIAEMTGMCHQLQVLVDTELASWAKAEYVEGLENDVNMWMWEFTQTGVG